MEVFVVHAPHSAHGLVNGVVSIVGRFGVWSVVDLKRGLDSSVEVDVVLVFVGHIVVRVGVVTVDIVVVRTELHGRDFFIRIILEPSSFVDYMVLVPQALDADLLSIVQIVLLRVDQVVEVILLSDGHEGSLNSSLGRNRD